MKRIVIDCGHGGQAISARSTPIGARGRYGRREKDVTLAVGSRVAALLGPTARLTRARDANLSLEARQSFAGREQADVFVSIHANDGAPDALGPETWVHSRASSASQTLAEALQDELARATGPDRGVYRGDLAVLVPERLPQRTAACLVELDYLSSDEGERRLSDPDTLEALAQALARGIRRFGHGPLATGLATVYDVWCETEQTYIREGLTSLQRAHEVRGEHDAVFQQFPGGRHLVVVRERTVPDPVPVPTPTPAPTPIHLPPHIYFDYDSDVIRPDQQGIIGQIVDWLRDSPGRRLHIVGHASAEGDLRHNQALSERRARAVATAIEHAALPYRDANPIASITGRGEEGNPNEPESALATHRRVDIFGD